MDPSSFENGEKRFNDFLKDDCGIDKVGTVGKTPHLNGNLFKLKKVMGKRKVEMAETVFKDEGELLMWLLLRGVSDIRGTTVENVAHKLFENGFDRPSTLIGINAEWLGELFGNMAMCQHLRNKLLHE